MTRLPLNSTAITGQRWYNRCCHDGANFTDFIQRLPVCLGLSNQSINQNGMNNRATSKPLKNACLSMTPYHIRPTGCCYPYRIPLLCCTRPTHSGYRLLIKGVDPISLAWTRAHDNLPAVNYFLFTAWIHLLIPLLWLQLAPHCACSEHVYLLIYYFNCT